jgi:hypothetical protein
MAPMTKQKACMKLERAHRQVGATCAAEIGSFVETQEGDFPINLADVERYFTQ